jgi:hypothetical protein
MTSAGHLLGAGVYSEVYCVGSADYNKGESVGSPTIANVVTLPSNCIAGSGGNVNADIYSATTV